MILLCGHVASVAGCYHSATSAFEHVADEEPTFESSADAEPALEPSECPFVDDPAFEHSPDDYDRVA